MDKSLLLTLGHNSSAIFIDDNCVIGYEEERLTGIKADSQFLIMLLQRLLEIKELKM